jgi:hypothetical protein
LREPHATASESRRTNFKTRSEGHHKELLSFFVRWVHLAGVLTADKQMLRFVAGPEDLIDDEDTVARLRDPDIQQRVLQQDAAMEGRRGALLHAVSVADGSRPAELTLDSLPIFDGLIAANGCLYMSTVDGKVVCLAQP